jgi:putative MATE family efflux protein
MQTAEIKENLNDGRLWRVMIKLSVPSIIGFFFYGLNNLLDGIFVGYYLGEDAFSGLTFAYPIVQMISGFGLLIGMGGANVLSLALGANNHEKIQHIFGNTVVLSIILSALITVLGYLYSGPMIAAMGGSGESLVFGKSYLEIIFLGTLFNLVSGGVNLLLRGEGNMMVAMKLFCLVTVFNSVLTPVFIAQLGWGVEGAAIATNLSFVVSCIVHYLYYFKNKREMYQLFRMKLDKKLSSEILKLGVPSLLLSVLILIQHYFVINLIVDISGQVDVAFFGALNRILMFSILPVYGMSRALQPVIGILQGSNKLRLSRKVFWLFNNVGSGIMLIIVFLVVLFSRPILGLLMPDLILEERHFFYYVVLMSSLVLMPVMVFSMTYIQSVGKAGLAGILVILRQILLFVPIVYILIHFYQLQGLYLSFIITDFLLMFIGVYLIHRHTKG